MGRRETDTTDYIWISRWEDFQHYAPDRDRAPSWIKTYTKQLDDDDYRGLTNIERALLHDLRMSFAKAHGQLTKSTRSLSHRIGYRVMNHHLISLNHAGLIEFISRATLEQRLELFYASRAPAHSRREESKTKTEKKSSSTSSKSSPIQEARPQGETNGDHPDRLVFDETAFMGRVDEMKQRKIDEPYFERLLKAVGDTEENFAKLRRASRGKPPAALVNALEAAQNPATRDRLAVALTVLADYVAA